MLLPRKPLLLSNLIKLSISKEFNNICSLKLSPRQTNHVSDCTESKDPLLHQLTAIYFSRPKIFKRLKVKINSWMKNEQSETIFALAGYIYYIAEDFIRAKRCFLRAISLNPDNLDNWIDLAFTLRHNGEYAVSNAILFSYDYVIYYYKYLKMDGCSFHKLKDLILKINDCALNSASRGQVEYLQGRT